MNFLEEPTHLFEHVGARLVEAGWLHHFSFIANHGYSFKWTEVGLRRVLLIWHIIGEFQLASDPQQVERFTRDCQNPSQALDNASNTTCAFRDYWLACLEELSLDREEIYWWAFVLIVNTGILEKAGTNRLSGLAILHLEDTTLKHAGERKHRYERQWIFGSC